MRASWSRLMRSVSVSLFVALAVISCKESISNSKSVPAATSAPALDAKQQDDFHRRHM